MREAIKQQRKLLTSMTPEEVIEEMKISRAQRKRRCRFPMV